MSRAILIMDMPENCGDCMFSNPDGDYCPFLGKVSLMEYERTRKETCPLREPPAKRAPERASLSPSLKVYHREYDKGWNACLDAITGDANLMSNTSEQVVRDWRECTVYEKRGSRKK